MTTPKKTEPKAYQEEEPIKISESEVTNYGTVKMDFSRPITINSTERRNLASSDEQLSDREIEEIKSAIIVKFLSSNEQADATEITEVNIISATLTELEFSVTYSETVAISQFEADPCILEVYFDSSIISDSDSEFELNDGEPMVIKLPRQVDPETAEAIQSTMNKV